MTVDEITAVKVEPELDRAIQKRIADAEAFYIENNFEDDWIEEVIARQRRELESWKSQKLAEIHAWLARGGEHLQ